MSNFWKRLPPGLRARPRQGPDGVPNRPHEPGEPSRATHVPTAGCVDQRLLRCTRPATAASPGGGRPLEAGDPTLARLQRVRQVPQCTSRAGLHRQVPQSAVAAHEAGEFESFPIRGDAAAVERRGKREKNNTVQRGGVVRPHPCWAVIY